MEMYSSRGAQHQPRCKPLASYPGTPSSEWPSSSSRSPALLADFPGGGSQGANQHGPNSEGSDELLSTCVRLWWSQLTGRAFYVPVAGISMRCFPKPTDHSRGWVCGYYPGYLVPRSAGWWGGRGGDMSLSPGLQKPLCPSACCRDTRTSPSSLWGDAWLCLHSQGQCRALSSLGRPKV